MRVIALIISLLIAGYSFGQKSKSNTAKIDFTQFPTAPVKGMSKLGIQVYTNDLPFNKDTLRLYLGNMDIMKSDVERMSKVNFKALNEVALVGGQGDVTVSLAFGKPIILSKEQKTASCVVAKDGCTQYFYKVEYRLPAIAQASNSQGVLDTWELNSDMTLQFGNEQIEKHKKTEKGSSTSIQVISYTSIADLALAFNSSGQATLARKAIVKQIGNLAESIYERIFFEETKLKFDIAYGSGSAKDYAETETAAADAIAALESKNYASLQGPIKIWESWLELYNPDDKKAAVNDKVAQGFHENLSIAYSFTDEFDKARTNLDKAIKFSQSGFVNQNEVERLKAFHSFINKQENVKKYNSALALSEFVTAPDIKKLLGQRKFNEDINFLFAEDKYAELSKSYGQSSSSKDISEMSLDELLNQSAIGGNGTSDNGEISLEGRVENDMLVLSGLIDASMRGKALPESICEYPDIKTIRARNIGLTSLPDCMIKLTKMEKLFINSNSFSELPDIFGGMKNLEILDISNNNLKSLPHLLTNIKKIYCWKSIFQMQTLKLEDSLPSKIQIILNLMLESRKFKTTLLNCTEIGISLLV